MARILQWCSNASASRVWLTTGEAGCGKTRVLIEVTERLDTYRIGWVRHGAGVRIAELAIAWQRPVLLVVDDADTSPDLEAVLKMVQRSDNVRVLLTARDGGSWWMRLREGLSSDAERSLPVYPQLRLDSLVEDGESQKQRFLQAVRYFARANDCQPPPVTWVVPDRRVSLLLLHAAAAVSVRDLLKGPIVADAAVNRLFEIEEEWWQENAIETGLPVLGLPTLRDGVVLAASFGAANLDSAVHLLRHLPQLANANEDLLRSVAFWLRRLYPNKAGSWLEPHLPAHLAERYVAKQLAENPPLLAAVADYQISGQQAAVEILLRSNRSDRAIRLLAAASRHTAEAEGVISRLMRNSDANMLAKAIVVARDGIGPIDNALASVIESADLTARDAEELDALIPPMTAPGLLRTAVVLGQRMLAFSVSDEQRAERLSNLGARLSHLGKLDEARPIAAEAVDLYRYLSDQRPTDLLPGFGMALNNLGHVFSMMGRPEDAANVAVEAVEVHRRWAAIEPKAEHQLVLTLGNLGAARALTGRIDEALSASCEAVEISRRLVDINPPRSQQYLAQSLDNVANRFAEAGRLEEALTYSLESVSIYRRLAAAEPTLFDVELARSLNHLSVRCAKLGRRAEAMTNSREAVDTLLKLAASEPLAFDPELAGAQENLGRTLAEGGRLDEALAATKQAVGTFRRLAATNPAVFESGLAGSLNNLGAIMTVRGLREPALGVTIESAKIFRRLYAERPVVNGSDLATSLVSLGNRLAEMGRGEEALIRTEEAVQVCRRLVEMVGEAREPDLGMSLNNLSNRLAERGRQTEALEAAVEAVSIFQRFSSQLPDAYAEYLSIAQANLRQRESGL